MTECALCGEVIPDVSDQTVWKEVSGWVGGPRKDSMRLRHDTGNYAHDRCVAKLQAGQAIDQTSLFEEVTHERATGEAELPDELRD